jgi:hypothetical protein
VKRTSKAQLLARIAAGKRLATGDSDDAVVRTKRSETAESVGQECGARDAQRLAMRRNGEAAAIAPHAIHRGRNVLEAQHLTLKLAKPGGIGHDINARKGLLAAIIKKRAPWVRRIGPFFNN